MRCRSLPHPLRTAVPKAFVALRKGVPATRETALKIFQPILRTLAPYKRVRRTQFGELPKTISGKIRRVEFRRAEQSRPEKSPALSRNFEKKIPPNCGRL